MESGILRRLEEVQSRIRMAVARSGRPEGSVRLIAATKTVAPHALAGLIAAGHRCLGENRVQEAEAKAAVLGGAVEWHLIGHLQRNKARRAAAIFDWVHTIDSIDLAVRLARAAVDCGRLVEVLVQVRLDAAAGRSGVPPRDLERLLPEVAAQPGVRLRGLMLLPPPAADAEASRPAFRMIRELAAAEAASGRLPVPHELSMGMSSDYEVAVEEGATMVRVGTALFGERDRLRP
jgi:pyridoxal phosphate enzyme (YggS family)